MYGKFFISLALLASLLLNPAHAQVKQKVVYHVSEAERVQFVLGNIENHIRSVGGPDKVDIVLVAHGPALKAFEKKDAQSGLSDRVAELKKSGVSFDACGNTLRNNRTTLGDLIGGFERVDQGGVVRIVELQQQGYIYIRP
jgi:intracellular sulfur oxidation DsrE/DsrF family protein